MLVPALPLAACAGAATLAGGTIALRAPRFERLLQGFSAGAVLGVVLFDLGPEVLGLVNPAIAAGLAVLGFGLYAAIDRIGRRGDAAASAALILHSLTDGFGLALGFGVSARTGVLLATGIITHDLADGVNIVSVNRRPAAPAWLALNTLAPILGAVLGWLWSPSAAVIGLALSPALGAFSYIGLVHLGPRVRSWTGLAAMAVGVAMIWAASRLAGS
jgi:zinc transporter ZupT